MSERIWIHLIDELPAIVAALLAGVAAIQARHASKAAKGAKASSDLNGQALIDCPYVRVDRRSGPPSP